MPPATERLNPNNWFVFGKNTSNTAPTPQTALGSSAADCTFPRRANCSRPGTARCKRSVPAENLKPVFSGEFSLRSPAPPDPPWGWPGWWCSVAATPRSNRTSRGGALFRRPRVARGVGGGGRMFSFPATGPTPTRLWEISRTRQCASCCRPGEKGRVVIM